MWENRLGENICKTPISFRAWIQTVKEFLHLNESTNNAIIVGKIFKEALSEEDIQMTNEKMNISPYWNISKTIRFYYNLLRKVNIKDWQVLARVQSNWKSHMLQA